MVIKTLKQLEKLIVDKDYDEIKNLAGSHNGTFLSLVWPLSEYDRIIYSQMVEKYRKRYSPIYLEKAVATKEKLDGIEVVKLMVYLRRPDTPSKKKPSNKKRCAVSLQY